MLTLKTLWWPQLCIVEGTVQVSIQFWASSQAVTRPQDHDKTHDWFTYKILCFLSEEMHCNEPKRHNINAQHTEAMPLSFSPSLFSKCSHTFITFIRPVTIRKFFLTHGYEQNFNIGHYVFLSKKSPLIKSLNVLLY